MLSQPATKIFLKTTEPNAAEWISNAIGKVEIERVKETHSQGTRSGKSFTIDRQIEPLVMDSEISGLEDKHAFLKLGNFVARFNFDYLEIPRTIPAFVPRKVENDELEFDPKTLKPKPTASKPDAAETALGSAKKNELVKTASLRRRARKRKSQRPSAPERPPFRKQRRNP